jgi:peroxiredoxin
VAHFFEPRVSAYQVGVTAEVALDAAFWASARPVSGFAAGGRIMYARGNLVRPPSSLPSMRSDGTVAKVPRLRFVGALVFIAVGALFVLGRRGLLRRKSAWPATPAGIAVGKPLPPLVLTDDRGQPVALSSLRGPTLWLFFRSASCPFCRTQLGAFAKAAAKLRAAGLNLVATSPDTPDTLATLRRQLALPMQLLADNGEQTVTAVCGGVAHCELLVDAQGVVRWGAFSESWSQTPGPEALLDLASDSGLVGTTLAGWAP